MALTNPLTWAAGALASANLNTHVRDLARWAIGHSGNPKPHGIATLGTPIALTSTAFTYVIPDTAVRDRGGAWSGGFVVPTGAAGVYHFTSSVYTAAGQGNKELRIARNGDENDYCGVQNQYGVATPAVSALSVSGRFELAVGDTVDPMLYMDDPSPFNCTVSIFTWCWEATDL